MRKRYCSRCPTRLEPYPQVVWENQSSISMKLPSLVLGAALSEVGFPGVPYIDICVDNYLYYYKMDRHCAQQLSSHTRTTSFQPAIPPSSRVLYGRWFSLTWTMFLRTGTWLRTDSYKLFFCFFFDVFFGSASISGRRFPLRLSSPLPSSTALFGRGPHWLLPLVRLALCQVIMLRQQIFCVSCRWFYTYPIYSAGTLSEIPVFSLLIKSFWNGGGNFMTANTGGGRSGKGTLFRCFRYLIIST